MAGVGSTAARFADETRARLKLPTSRPKQQKDHRADEVDRREDERSEDDGDYPDEEQDQGHDQEASTELHEVPSSRAAEATLVRPASAVRAARSF